jgi:hypothetical protein
VLAGGEGVEQADDVGMIEVTEASFVPGQVDPAGARRDLDGDVAIDDAVISAVDDAESTCADDVSDLCGRW